MIMKGTRLKGFTKEEKEKGEEKRSMRKSKRRKKRERKKGATKIGVGGLKGHMTEKGAKKAKNREME